MIGAFAAFGVDFNLSVLAVLSYRGISFWLPTLPGTVAYFQLRRTVARWRESEQSDRSLAARTEPREAPDLRKIRAHQCEVMMAVGLADTAHALERALVADVPAERVTGIGRIGNDASGAHQIRRAADEAQLRINGVQLQVLGQT